MANVILYKYTYSSILRLKYARIPSRNSFQNVVYMVHQVTKKYAQKNDFNFKKTIVLPSWWNISHSFSSLLDSRDIHNHNFHLQLVNSKYPFYFQSYGNLANIVALHRKGNWKYFYEFQVCFIFKETSVSLSNQNSFKWEVGSNLKSK